MKEIVFRYGENDRGLGMITLPHEIQGAPVVVMLNSGLLHRAEPYRLNVLVGRILSEIGYICLRVDLSGKGDTPVRKGLTNRESVALDWQYIKRSLKQSFGQRTVIIMGICSGADNGIKISAFDSDVKGLILMDSVAKKDQGFKRRELLNNLLKTYKWSTIPKRILMIMFRKKTSSDVLHENRAALRDPPNDKDFQQCFQNLIAGNGKILAIFTVYALSYYNKQGQFAKGMGAPGLEQICEEIFWPNVQHIYPIQEHRDRLLTAIKAWGERYIAHFRTRGPL